MYETKYEVLLDEAYSSPVSDVAPIADREARRDCSCPDIPFLASVFGSYPQPSMETVATQGERW